MNRKQLGVFAKVPEPGRVKTRLIPPLSPDAACALYRAFLEDLFARLGKLAKLDLTVFYDGDDVDEFASMVPRRAEFVAQRGDDLGARLAAAFDHLLPRGPAVVIGSDSPDLPLQFIKRAHQRLKHKDVVVGPAADGGYYLIGLSRPAPELFRGIRFSRPSVLDETVSALEAGGRSLALLPVWYDVDDPQSLDVLASLIRARRLATPGMLPATARALERIRNGGC